jgi:tetratricopeptide (TPR) repeat protein
MNHRDTEETQENPDNWLERGNELFNQGDFPGAIASFDNAIKFKPDFHEALFNRGVALFNLGRVEDATSVCPPCFI